MTTRPFPASTSTLSPAPDVLQFYPFEAGREPPSRDEALDRIEDVCKLGAPGRAGPRPTKTGG